MPAERSGRVGGARTRAVALCASLVVVNIGAWGWAAVEFRGNAVLLGAAVLAYVFGLRHAVDADHIAAIDNATRTLIEAGRPAIATGLFFSLGHATVVVLMALAVALTTAQLQASTAALKPLAVLIGTSVSALSLFALALANCVILVSVLRLCVAVRGGARPAADAELTRLLAKRGLISRLLRGVFRLIAKSWHMYPLGFLFGLGFDTATEIGVLAMSAAQASHGLPLAAIMVFPALFTAGMALVDTLDALLMVGAYGWAAVEPLRKLYYNIVVTLTSVVVAAAIGGIELLGLFTDGSSADRLSGLIGYLDRNPGTVGTAIIALFALTWFLSAMLRRARAAPSSSG